MKVLRLGEILRPLLGARGRCGTEAGTSLPSSAPRSPILGEITSAPAVAAAAGVNAGSEAEPAPEGCSCSRWNTLPQNSGLGGNGQGGPKRTLPRAPRHPSSLRPSLFARRPVTPSPCHPLTLSRLPLAALLLVPTVAFAVPGELDPNFGTGGIAISDLQKNELADGVVAAKDGSIYVAATEDPPGPNPDF